MGAKKGEREFKKGHKCGFKPGQSGNPFGRPKTSVTKLSDSTGYSKAEVVRALVIIMNYDQEQLQACVDNLSLPVFERTAAAIVLDCLKKKSFREIDSVLNRTFGMPKAEIQIDAVVETKQTITLPDGTKLEL